ncbi:MAG: hypothetical protein AMJ94_04590, partial [Deltaproteobacteria bacterium SM23_61]
MLIPPPLRLADDPQGIHGKRISRRCLLRNLTFLPGPWQAFLKHSTDEFGDERHFLIKKIFLFGKKFIFHSLGKRVPSFTEAKKYMEVKYEN